MEPVYYTVNTINGDYAYMTSDSGVENQVAMFLPSQMIQGEYITFFPTFQGRGGEIDTEQGCAVTHSPVP